MERLKVAKEYPMAKAAPVSAPVTPRVEFRHSCRRVTEQRCSAAFALGRMKITMKSAISAAIAFFLITCPDLGAATDDWRYEVLAQDKVIKAAAITSKAGDNLLEFKTISVGGFRTARFFVQVLRSDFQKNRGGFTPDAKLRVACFHNTKNGSHHYFEKEIPMTFGAYINGWVEIPIIGPELRVIVWGDNIPKLEMSADCTIYLLK
jgi:hypothetical protein